MNPAVYKEVQRQYDLKRERAIRECERKKEELLNKEPKYKELIDKKNKLAYLPETVVKMFYGGTSSGGLKSYIESFIEGHRALKINGIRFALVIGFMRTINVLKQFVMK